MGTTEDKLEILDLITRYGYACDEDDPEAFADLFTEHGAFEVLYPDRHEVTHGREQLIDFKKRIIARWTGKQLRHFQVNSMVLELTSERATARSYGLVTLISSETAPTVLSTGVYYDDLVHTPAGWRFEKHRLVLDPRAELAQGTMEEKTTT